MADQADDKPARRRGGFLLNRVAKVMGRVFEALMKAEGIADIGSGEGRLVYLLWQEGPLRQGELAAKAGIDKSTLALTLPRMEQKGLVRRSRDGGDGRAVIVSLNAPAVSRADAFERVSRAMNERFYTGMDDEEIDAFERTLIKILANLEKDGGTDGRDSA